MAGAGWTVHRMRMFDATMGRFTFGAAVVVPPLIFWSSVVALTEDGTAAISVTEVALLMLAAQALPLAALAWMLCSVATYSVGEGWLEVHRVIGDRRYRLADLVAKPQRSHARVRLRFRARRLVVRTARAEEFVAEIERAAREAV